MDEERQFFAKPLPDGVIPCATWDLGADPTRLPGLPSLPKLTATGELDEAVDEIKIIKIAALDAHLVALTNQGHVVLFSGLGDENTGSTGRWQYASNLAHSSMSADSEYKPLASQFQRARSSAHHAALHANRRVPGR
jgi:SCF-associated factor 1